MNPQSDSPPERLTIRLPKKPPPEWLTVFELAGWLRVSLPTVYGMIKRGEVPGVVRLGRVLRISRGAVLLWAEQGCAPRNIGR